MDLIMDLPNSDGYDTIVVVIDPLTKMSHFICDRKDLDVRHFTTLLLKEIIRVHGIPHDIMTDRGTLLPHNSESTLQRNCESNDD